VLDFGISQSSLTGSAFSSRSPRPATMLPMGSPVYMSPETNSSVDRMSDARNMTFGLWVRPARASDWSARIRRALAYPLSADDTEEQPAKNSEWGRAFLYMVDAIVMQLSGKIATTPLPEYRRIGTGIYPSGQDVHPILPRLLHAAQVHGALGW